MSDDQVYVGSTERLLQLEAALARFAGVVNETVEEVHRCARRAMEEHQSAANISSGAAAICQQAADADTEAGRDATFNTMEANRARSNADASEAAAEQVQEAVEACMREMGPLLDMVRRGIPEGRTFIRRRVAALEEYFAAGGSPE